MFQGLFKHIKESSIDYPSEGLDPVVWELSWDPFKEGRLEGYMLKDKVKKKILFTLALYPKANLLKIADRILIVGSIGSNQYVDDSDIDVHIHPNFEKNKDEIPEFDSLEDWQKDIMIFFRENEEFIEKHPIEVYLQLDPSQDTGKQSVAAYDIMTDEWLVGPALKEIGFDPYETFGGVIDDVRDIVAGSDEILGELNRDVIDYKVIQAALKRLPGEQKNKVLDRLKSKLEEIEDSIEELVKDKDEFVQIRRGGTEPDKLKTAKSQALASKEWKDRNAAFKFLQRYGYLKTITDLEKVLDDNEVTDNEIDVIKDILQ